MKPWETSIKQPVFISMIMLALIVLGVLAYTGMPLDFFPNVSYPTLAVITVYAGAGPGEIESQVTKPIEEAMVTAPGVEEVQSRSNEGYSVVVVSFNLDKDEKVALQEVREKIANVRSNLPDGALEPTITAYDPSSLPILRISVGQSNSAGNAATDVRLKVTEDVLPRLQRLDGVADAVVTGGHEREIQVLLDADALNARRVAPQQVIATIVAESYSIPGGSVEQAGQDLLLRTPGNFKTVEDVANLQIATALGAVRVGDIATVQDGWKERDTYSRLDGQEAVIVSVRKQSGTNTVQVAERVKKEVAALSKERPDINLVAVQDQSIFVRASFNDAMRELLIGALAASLIVLLFFRNLRNTLVTVAGLPIILLGTFAVMSARGMTLNIISLMALSLSVGLIIDDAIVVRENIFRHMEMGKTPKQASIEGTAEVAMPVIAMSLTIVSVFLPVAFVGGLMGKFLNSFGLVVSMAVLISLVEAMTFAPMLSAYLFKQQKPKISEAEAQSGVAHASLGRIERLYLRSLGWTLRHRFVTLVLGIALLAASAYGATFLKQAFVPSVDQGSVDMSLTLPPGGSLTQTDEQARTMETRLLAMKPVKSVLTTVGGRGTPETASFHVNLKDGYPTSAFAATARGELTDVPGLSISGGSFISMVAGGNSIMGKPVQITLQTVGDAEALNQFSVKLEEKLKAVPGLVDVDISYQPGKPEVLLVVDRRKAADMGINIATVGSTIRTLVEGVDVATFRGEGAEADIRVQLQEADRARLDQILDLQMPTTRGFIPLRQIAHMEEASGPTQLNRIDRQPAVIIGAETFGRVQADVTADVTKIMTETALPAGVTWAYTGEQKLMADAFAAMGTAMLLAVVFVYMVLASQFGSFIQPLIIMLALPLAAIGGLLALLVFKLPLDMTALIGLILLFGLVTKNSILLVDLTNKMRRQRGMDIHQALRTAGPIRLRPILMTTLALILGMLPVAIGLGTGSGFRQPMAITVIGGLITSTLLTLLLVPTAYSLVEGALARSQRARAERAVRRAAQEAAKQRIKEPVAA
ncbi:MAG: efflux RND transporter permease subunit [Chloroflexi bacterium]|nr:efflux RND transporter permease subunit [Chloroflexota bacterium]